MRFDGDRYRVEGAGYDAAGPRLRSLSIPASAERGEPAAFSVSPLDVWSPVAATSWSFGDGRSTQGDSVRHPFAKVGTYQVTVTSTDAVGNTSSASGAVAVRDTRKPRIKGLRVTPSAIRAAAPRSRARGSARRKRQRPKGARIRFRLNEAARVVFTAKRRVRRCRRGRCARRLVKVRGRLTAAGRQGANAVRFSGRLGGRPLPRGRYVLTARATDPSRNRSRPVTAAFRVR